MRISDWSSDVCSSDLNRRAGWAHLRHHPRRRVAFAGASEKDRTTESQRLFRFIFNSGQLGMVDRKSVVKGKRVEVRVDIGGRRIIKRKIQYVTCYTSCKTYL